MADIQPSKANVVWQLAVTLKTFLTAFLSKPGHSRLQQKTIRDLLTYLDQIIQSPKKNRDDIQKIIEKVSSTLQSCKESSTISRVIDEHRVKKPQADEKDQKESKTSDTPIPKIETSSEILERILVKPIDPKKFKPLEMKLPKSALLEGVFTRRILRTLKQLEKYHDDISAEIKQGKQYDTFGRLFKMDAYNKNIKQAHAKILIDKLKKALMNRDYTHVREFIRNSPPLFGALTNGRLEKLMTRLNDALNLDPKKPEDLTASVWNRVKP